MKDLLYWKVLVIKMIDLWVRLIEGGQRSFEDCPDSLKDSVRAILIADGFLSEDTNG